MRRPSHARDVNRDTRHRLSRDIEKPARNWQIIFDQPQLYCLSPLWLPQGRPIRSKPFRLRNNNPAALDGIKSCSCLKRDFIPNYGIDPQTLSQLVVVEVTPVTQ